MNMYHKKLSTFFLVLYVCGILTVPKPLNQANINSKADKGHGKQIEKMVSHDYGLYVPKYLGDPCKEPFAKVGNCRGAIQKWSYNQEKGDCELFRYGGCGRNNNNFETYKQCYYKCVPREHVMIGRPFIVDGISRTTNSDICTDTDSDKGDENDLDSWRVGGAPSVPPSGKHNQEIGLYWLKQAEGEHASVASFARHTLQLMSKGAPARLLEAAQNAALDEIKHAKMCYGIASAFLGKRIGPGSLDVVGSLENMELEEIVESLIVEGCFGETLSAIEARLAAHYAQDDAVKEALKEIATDETRHGQLAWDTVGWIVKKQPDIQNYVNDVFEAQLKKLVVPAKNDTSLYGTPLCEDSEKETTLHRYGLLDKDDREKVRDVGIRDIIEPVYRAGFKHVNSISKGIMELNMNDL